MRYWGLYRGTVIDNKDPEFRCRLKIEVPLPLDEAVTDWVKPNLPMLGYNNAGFFFPPYEGSKVWVQFEQGDVDKPVWGSGGWPLAPEGLGEVPNAAIYVEKEQAGDWDDPELSMTKRVAPTNRVIETKIGAVEFDEEVGQEKILWRDNKGQFILIRTADGREKIHFKDKAGNRFLLDSVSGQEKILLQSPTGSFVKIDSQTGDITISSVNDVQIHAGGNIYHT